MNIEDDFEAGNQTVDERIRISITVRPASEDDPIGYLGAMSSYPPRDGETWRRGNDLADGPADGVTLARIMADIAAVMAGHANEYNYQIAQDARRQGISVAEAHRQQMIAVNMPDIPTS